MKAAGILSILAISLIGINKASAQSEATFYTTMGSFTIDLTDTLTPITVDSFISRVAGKFYDGQIFHRVINNFMIQGGDPNGNGSGDPGYSIPDEFHPSLKNVQKSLSMANRGPNTGGSQFFINLVDNLYLDNRHAVYGIVSNNFEVVQNIGKTPVAPGDRPVTEVKIDSIRITRFPAVTGTITAHQPIQVSRTAAKGVFNVNLPDKSTKIEVLNKSGEVVVKTKGKGSTTVDVSKQPNGIYIMRFSGKKGDGQSKIVVQ